MIPREIIQSAKRADLPVILKKLGVNIIAEGKSFYLHEHDSLKFFKQEGVWLYKWWSCGETGDGIQYLMNHCGKNFREAVKLLSGYNDTSHSNQFKNRDNWKTKSSKIVRISQTKLFGSEGKKALYYLLIERGLHSETIEKFHIGWLPENNQMPSKIVIPCYNSKGDLMRVKFRIDNPESNHGRYRVMKGSNTKTPFSSNISINKPVIIVESELDAILIDQVFGEDIGVLSLGGVCTNLSIQVISYLNEKVPVNLISLDNDKAGQASALRLMKCIKNTYNWPIPEGFGKDPTEAYKKMNLKNWILEGLTKGGYNDRSRNYKK
ncbi:MAG: P4 alpha zinc-binding domain-containing protein [Candidatus Magnetoglobus multicellularis str. Araruama]|uniref:P4 alpha zinc-binding domain-containing protein n=1 Tax=Candidatus Magnetoglobus multicellularis str. Araruama TaxID=890399 RepID=A0A1V1P772_9BACT|nr:MAG: P4 alpha zinc-binding domain-containing protein [Candidatus Magnetoglobus multicellularis str. Araruama]